MLRPHTVDSCALPFQQLLLCLCCGQMYLRASSAWFSSCRRHHSRPPCEKNAISSDLATRHCLFRGLVIATVCSCSLPSRQLTAVLLNSVAVLLWLGSQAAGASAWASSHSSTLPEVAFPRLSDASRPTGVRRPAILYCGSHALWCVLFELPPPPPNTALTADPPPPRVVWRHPSLHAVG